jgi:hypothetical protein
MDNVLTSFENKYKDALREEKEGIIQNPRKFYIGRLRDMSAALAISNNLMDSYLSGRPVNVFYVNEKPTPLS